MTRIHLLLFLACLATLAAATVPTFCKCTCFTNSTIIPLGPQHDNPPSDPVGDNRKPMSRRADGPAPLLLSRASSSSCTQCNRAFCLKYNLPICKDAEEKDITTSCFQRDSRKDQVIVWGFILGTAGLLGWAGLRRLVELRDANKSGGGMLGSLPLGLGGSRGASGGHDGVGAGGGPDGGGGLLRRVMPGGSGGGAYAPLEDPRASGARGGG